MTNIAIEHGHGNNNTEFSDETWGFFVAMLIYQRVHKQHYEFKDSSDMGSMILT